MHTKNTADSKYVVPTEKDDSKPQVTVEEFKLSDLGINIGSDADAR